MHDNQVVLVVLIALLAMDLAKVSGAISTYPEKRSDLQSFQDASRCYPDVGEWYLTYRNYYYDPYFGGSAKCVKYQRYGTYENFSTPIMLTFPDGEVRGRFSMSSSECYSTKDAVTFVRDDESTQSFHIIYTDCQICSILRHPYAANGYGCSYWRRTSTLHESDDCCKFIYDQNCGTSPMYQMYDRSCQS